MRPPEVATTPSSQSAKDKYLFDGASGLGLEIWSHYHSAVPPAAGAPVMSPLYIAHPPPPTPSSPPPSLRPSPSQPRQSSTHPPVCLLWSCPLHVPSTRLIERQSLLAARCPASRFTRVMPCTCSCNAYGFVRKVEGCLAVSRIAQGAGQPWIMAGMMPAMPPATAARGSLVPCRCVRANLAALLLTHRVI